MSLILEALKKSEAERQRGKAPGLFVDQAVLPRRRRTGAPAWAYGLGVLFVVVVAVFGWREWSRGDLAVVGTPPETSSASVEGSRDVASGLGSAESAAVPPLPPAEAGRREGAPGAGALPTGSGLPPPPPAPARTGGSADVADVPAPSQRAAPTPVVPQATTQSSASTAAPTLPPAGALRSEGQPDASEIPMPTLPRLADLPASERNALPPMNVTMHVFADDPAQRFVILDGRRYGEGATPADGVVIQEIRRDGLVLSLGGRDVLLPRP